VHAPQDYECPFCAVVRGETQPASGTQQDDRQHNEPAGNQEVWHYHLHVFPRYARDDLYGSLYRETTLEERLPYARRPSA
jgi:hypothetical protein